MFNRACLNALLLTGLAMTIAGCTSGDPSLTSITVTPTTMAFGGTGLTTQLTATGSYTHPGHPATLQNITDQVTWASSTPQCVTVSQTGLITSGPNVCTNILVTASMPGFPGLISGSMTVNVTQPSNGGNDVVAVSVIPATQTVASLNVPIQYEAIGTTSGGLTVALGNYPQQLKWASSTGTVATINATSGLATTAGSGTSTITATFTNADGTGAIGTATLTVAPTGSPEPLTAITIAPNAQTATAANQTAQFLAIATTGSGTSVNLTNQSAIVDGKTILAAVWSSSNPSVATISATTGLATAGTTAGAAIITAIATNPDGSIVTGTATFTVTLGSSAAEPLTALTIQPSTQSVATAGQTSQFLAIGTFSANSATPGTQNMANIPGYTVAWYSSNPSVGTICTTGSPAPCTAATNGLVTAVGQGVTAITAIATNNTDKSAAYATATFTVTGPTAEPISALSIFPGTQSITLPLVGQPQQTATFVAIGTNGATGLQSNVSTQVSWNSTNPLVATINTNGIATALTQGTTTITAIATNADKSVETATATLTVAGSASEPLLSVAVVPGTESVAYPGQTGQFTAIGTFTPTPTQPLTQILTNTATWTSSNPAVATVCSTLSPAPCTASTNGLVTAKGQGTAVIIVTAQNPDGSAVTGTANFTVVNAASEPVASLQIVPTSQSMAKGQTAQFIVLGTDGTTGLQSDLTTDPGLTWSSSIPAIGTICNAGPGQPSFCPTTPGLATGVTAGTTTITAQITNPDKSVVTATALATVTSTVAISGDVISVTIQPASQSDIFIDQTTQFIAIGTSALAPFTFDVTNCNSSNSNEPASCNGGSTAWASSNVDVATINTTGTQGPNPGGIGAPAGLATMIFEGTTAITATFTNTDGSIATGVATLTCPFGQCSLTPPPNPPLVTLTVFGAGNNTTDWLVTAPSASGAPNAIHCGPGSVAAGMGNPVCVGSYPIGTLVTLQTNVTTGTFGGWASGPPDVLAVTSVGPPVVETSEPSPVYCTPTPATPTQTGINTCTIQGVVVPALGIDNPGITADETVVGIFNN